MTARSAAFDLRAQDGVVALSGDWTVWTIADVARPFYDAAHSLPKDRKIDLKDLGQIDMAGAYLIDRAEGELVGGSEAAHKLVETARAAHVETPAKEPRSGAKELLITVGRAVETFGKETVAT